MKPLKLSSETNEQKTVVQWCDLMKIPIVHIPNEGKRSVAYGALMKSLGLRKGFPDLFIPRARGAFHGLFIEMKYGSGKTSKEQDEWIDLLMREGYACTVCYDADDAIGAIKAYLAQGVK